MPLSLHMLDPLKAAKRGYAVVIQDTRGRYTSEGKFYAFKDDIHDGYDTVEWVASQPWSLGKVGMYGSSYVGATQWQAAKACPPHLAAIAPKSRPPTTATGRPIRVEPSRWASTCPGRWAI